jgi:hypothetical protein
MVAEAPIPERVRPHLAVARTKVPLPTVSELAPDTFSLLTGISPLDDFLGGLTLRRTHLLTGVRGSGITSFMHRVLATVTRSIPVLLLDPLARFHPPAAVAGGIHLPHVLWVVAPDPARIQRVLDIALREAPCPLIIWDAGAIPSAALLDRLLPRVRRGRSAVLIVAHAETVAPGMVDGATFAVTHERWTHGPRARPGCTGRVVTVRVSDHLRHRNDTFPLALDFPMPLPPLRAIGKGGGAHAGTTRRGGVAAGDGASGRRAG